MSRILSLLTLLASAFVASVTSCSQKVNYQQRNLNTITAIYNRTVYPLNLEILQNGSASVPPGLFNENATGRVSAIGNFSGFQDSVEYFFALAPVPQPPGYAAFTRAQVVEFTSGCPEVAASVVYFTTSVVNPNATNDGQYVTTLKQVAFWRFDSTGAVVNYDAWIPNLGAYTSIVRGTNDYTKATANATQDILALCGATQQLCTGNNTQYSSVADCAATLSAKPFGIFDEVWGDNVACREIHILLARVRPEVHCMHVGPTGGGKCVNEPYNEGYFDDVQLFGRPEGETFMCGGNSTMENNYDDKRHGKPY